MTSGALTGTTIGSYLVRHEIGAGGMGSVYLAEHTMLGRRAALKVLRPELSANQEMVTRFFNEARAASAIKSPGIVEIYDFGYHTDGSAYLVMELLEGESLTERLRRFRCLPLPQALVIARQISSALAPAHRAGIVHRDLKPDNVYLVPDAETATGERVKLLDFGIAKLSSDGLGRGMNLTATKTVMGSPQYMSPEQCRGSGVVDARADLYSVGCILYELICGRPPFVAEGFGELMGAHLHVAPPPLPTFAPATPPDVDALVQRLLAKDPAQRPQTAEVLAAALTELAAVARPAPATISVAVPSAAQTRPGSHYDSYRAEALAVLAPTTMRGGAGAVVDAPPPPPRRRVAVVVGSAVIALAGATLGIVGWRSADPSSPQIVTATPAEPVLSPVDASVAPIDASTRPAADAPLAPPPPADARDAGVDAKRPPPRPKPDAQEVVVPVAPVLPESLTRSQIMSGVADVVSNVRACAQSSGEKGSVYATIEVTPKGKVREVRVTSTQYPKLGRCVTSNVVHARFPETLTGGTARSVPFVLE